MASFVAKPLTGDDPGGLRPNTTPETDEAGLVTFVNVTCRWSVSTSLVSVFPVFKLVSVGPLLDVRSLTGMFQFHSLYDFF